MLLAVLDGINCTSYALHTVAAPSIAAASNQKIFSGQLAAASIQEQLLIKKYFYTYSKIELESI